MDEITITEMSKERILEALQDLKSQWAMKSPSKYYFALGHAIRSIEDAPNQSVEVGQTSVCAKYKTCGSTDMFPCSTCGDYIPSAT